MREAQFLCLCQEPTLTKFGVDRMDKKRFISKKVYQSGIKTLTLATLQLGYLGVKKKLIIFKGNFKGAFAQHREQNPRYPTKVCTFVFRPWNTLPRTVV